MDEKQEKRERPDILPGPTFKIKTAQCGSLYITINKNEDQIYEIFVHHGKAGNCEFAHKEAICKLIGLALNFDVPIDEIVKLMAGIRCPSPMLWGTGIHHHSCPDAIAQVLKKVIGIEENHLEEKKESQKKPEKISEKSCGICPDCGGSLYMSGGCAFCKYCGFERCEEGR